MICECPRWSSKIVLSKCWSSRRKLFHGETNLRNPAIVQNSVELCHTRHSCYSNGICNDIVERNNRLGRTVNPPGFKYLTYKLSLDRSISKVGVGLRAQQGIDSYR